MYNKKKIRKCPFCRENGGFIPLILPQVPLSGIHIEHVELEIYQKLNDMEAIEQYFDRGLCHTILKSGKNIGNQCSKKCLGITKLCKLHGATNSPVVTNCPVINCPVVGNPE